VTASGLPETAPEDEHPPSVTVVPPAADVVGRSGQAAGRAGRAAGGFADPDAPWQRLSRRSLIVRPLTDLVRLLPLLAGLVLLHSHDGGGLAWGIGVAALAVVTGVVHWATTRYLVTSERLYLRHGLLNQKRLSVARDRIRTVDITAHLLHRMLGVCKISIGTGRNDYRPGESFHLDGLTRADAESLRALLLAGNGAGAPVSVAAGAGLVGEAGVAGDGVTGAVAGAGAAVGVGDAGRVGGVGVADGAGGERTVAGADADPGEEIAALRLSWLRFAPLTTAGLVVLGVLFGAVVQLNNDTNLNLTSSGAAKLVITDYEGLSVTQRVLAAIAAAIIGYVLIAMAGYIAVYWKFRLAGYGSDTVRITRGLLSVRATTISRSRLRGVEISEPLLLRAARGARCVAITTGLRAGEGAQHEGAVLLPPAPRGVARYVARTMLGVPEELCSGPLVRHGRSALRRRFIRALTGAAVIVAAVTTATVLRHGPAWIWIASLAFVPAACLLAADRYRSLGHRLSGGWLVTCTGSLARRRSIVGTDAIIGWRIHQTWFQRRQGLMTLTATTAAGQQHYSVHDVPVEVGLAIAATATGGLVPPFLIP
jgi:putative membrane protein